MANERVVFTTPVGRLVGGSLYKPSTTDAEGKPLVTKTGPNAGQSRVEYYIAIAIPKGAETHWGQTAWGAPIWAAGHAAWPGGQAQHPTFAWKIEDGDSTIPNKKGKKPCDREGFPGHWILRFGGGYAPSVWNSDGSAPIQEQDAVKPGYYIQIRGSVSGNGSASQPGIYLNHDKVALAGFGPEIRTGEDVGQAGFGKGVDLPAGASRVPVGGMAEGAAPAPAPAPVAPPVAAPVAPPVAPPAADPAPVAVAPHPGFLTAAPPPPVAAPPAAAPPAAPARVMLPGAGGVAYEAFIASGWTDALLVQHGKMAA